MCLREIDGGCRTADHDGGCVMKKKLGLGGVLAMLAALCLALSACSSKSDKAYPVAIDGT